MIRGVHAMFYSSQPEEARAFIRDKLGMAGSDVGDGWLIFDVAEAEVGVHPGEKPTHEISFYCDDIEATVAELKGRGVEFDSDISDRGFGLVTSFKIPGDVPVLLYQPSYKKG